MASYTTLRVGEQIRIRRQTKGVYYTIVGEYEQSPIDGEWVYLHRLDRGFSLGARGRKLPSGSIVRVEDDFYRLRGYTALLDDGGTLDVILVWDYKSLGLPAIPHKPPRQPNAREKQLMKEAAEKQEQTARQTEIDAAAQAEREEAVCYECGQANHLVTIETGAKAWFLKFTFDDDGIKRWTCPGGNHIGYPTADETLETPSEPGHRGKHGAAEPSHVPVAQETTTDPDLQTVSVRAYGIVPTDSSDKEWIESWWAVPMWGRLIDEVREGPVRKSYRWRCNLTDADGALTVVDGVARSRDKAEQAVSDHMTELAIAFLKDRDVAVLRALAEGIRVVPADPAFQISGLNEMGLGVGAQFEVGTIPFIRVFPLDFAEQFLLVLFILTEDENEVRELLAMHAERQFVKALVDSAKRTR